MQECIPALSSWEKKALKTSIEKRDVTKHVPVLVLPDGRIVDGHHRWEVSGGKATVKVLNIPEEDAMALGIALNTCRRHLSMEQQKELQDHLRKNKELQRKTALQYRKQGMTQAEAAVRVGVPRQTLSDWERGGSIAESGNISSQKYSIPTEDHPKIHDRLEGGATAKEVAADYKVTPRRINQIRATHAKHIEREDYLDEQEHQVAEGIITPDGPFDVIAIDPPWPYGTKYNAGGRRAANPYPEMELEELAALELPAADHCVLWLWTTHKYMRESFALLDAWDFRDVAIVTWVKDRMGLGSWLRSQSEFCVMAVKGKPKVTLTNQTTIISGPLREHSRKPDEFYELVESLCRGAKLDYFSREPREGWAQVGNTPEKFAEE